MKEKIVDVKDLSGGYTFQRSKRNLRSESEYEARSWRQTLKENLRNYRFVTLFYGFIMMLMAGTLYGFSAYAPTMKDLLGYSQTEVSLIGTFGNLGIYCAFTMGFFYDKFKHRITIPLGIFLIGTGYLLTGLVVNGYIPGPAWLIILFYIMVGQGSYGLNISSLDVNIKNWDASDRGKVTGLLAGGFGLSSGMFTLIYSENFTENLAWFFYFMTITISVVAAAGIFILKPQPAVPKEVVSVSQTPGALEDEPLIGEDVPSVPKMTEYNATTFQMVKTLTFWLIYIAFLVSAGVGLMVINNIGSVRLTLGGKKGDSLQNISVILLSLFSFFGRLTFGFLSDRFQKKISRIFWLGLADLIIALTHLTFYIFPAENTMYILAAGTGLGYGGVMASVGTLVSLLFGTLHLGTNYGVVLTAPAVGTAGFGFMASQLYEMQISGENANCYGDQCYSLTFMLTAIANLMGGAAAFYLIVHHRRMLRKRADQF